MACRNLEAVRTVLDPPQSAAGDFTYVNRRQTYIAACNEIKKMAIDKFIMQLYNMLYKGITYKKIRMNIFLTESEGGRYDIKMNRLLTNWLCECIICYAKV